VAYPRKIKNTARKLWLSGYSYEKVVVKLNDAFPNADTPQRWRTILDWKEKEQWEVDAKVIAEKAHKKRIQERDEIVEENRAEELRDIETMNAAIQHVRYHLGRTDKDGKPLSVDHKALVHLVNAADKAMRRKRINRYGFDTITKVEIPNEPAADGADPDASADDGTLPVDETETEGDAGDKDSSADAELSILRKES
jgi:hypothetical protein